MKQRRVVAIPGSKRGVVERHKVKRGKRDEATTEQRQAAKAEHEDIMRHTVSIAEYVEATRGRQQPWERRKEVEAQIKSGALATVTVGKRLRIWLVPEVYDKWLAGRKAQSDLI